MANHCLPPESLLTNFWMASMYVSHRRTSLAGVGDKGLVGSSPQIAPASPYTRPGWPQPWGMDRNLQECGGREKAEDFWAFANITPWRPSLAFPHLVLVSLAGHQDGLAEKPGLHSPRTFRLQAWWCEQIRRPSSLVFVVGDLQTLFKHRAHHSPEKPELRSPTRCSWGTTGQGSKLTNHRHCCCPPPLPPQHQHSETMSRGHMGPYNHHG